MPIGQTELSQRAVAAAQAFCLGRVYGSASELQEMWNVSLRPFFDEFAAAVETGQKPLPSVFFRAYMDAGAVNPCIIVLDEKCLWGLFSNLDKRNPDCLTALNRDLFLPYMSYWAGILKRIGDVYHVREQALAVGRRLEKLVDLVRGRWLSDLSENSARLASYENGYHRAYEAFKRSLRVLEEAILQSRGTGLPRTRYPKGPLELAFLRDGCRKRAQRTTRTTLRETVQELAYDTCYSPLFPNGVTDREIAQWVRHLSEYCRANPQSV